MGGVPGMEVEVDGGLVRGLLEDQHPDLAGLPLRASGSGWDNVLYRLGEDTCVRLPRRELAAAGVEREQRWLPQLADALPLPVPTPVRCGTPGRGYPWRWSVCPWFDGETAAASPPSDPLAAAQRLGAFVRALHREAPADAPRNPWRGTALRDRATPHEQRVAQLGDRIDARAVNALWSHCLAQPEWAAAPVWIHGDLHPANLLVRRGELSAVIDFGDLGAGDPATDLAVAWMLFEPAARARFRDAAGGCDDPTWGRARGWALELALALLAHSDDAPLLRQIGQSTLAAVLTTP